MLRGDLSSLRRGDGASSIRGNSLRSAWRGASASSSRGDTLRVSWRGNRGGRHRGRGQYFTTECETVPLGKLVTEFTIDLVSCSPVGVEDARITNCAYAASYSLNDDKPFKAIVPGQPASWKPPPLPFQLVGDSGVFMRDQNGARFPDHPIQAAVQALFALDEGFDPSSINIMGCASSLGDILRFVRSVDSTFRFDVELIGDTLFLVRNCKNDVIPDVRGYGHSFLDSFTSADPDTGGSKSHQRIVSYEFGGLKCLVRFECDGYLRSVDGHDTTLTEPQYNFPDNALPDSIPIQKAGNIISQDAVLEIKTMSQARGEINKSDHLPRLWIRQIPHFINAYHKQGNFEDVQIHDVREELLEWETKHQDELKKFASILREIITEVKRASHLKLELHRVGVGPLQLRERKGAPPRHALPLSWAGLWAMRSGPSENGFSSRDDESVESDEDGETYPSTRVSSDGSDGSDADFSFDYTECSLECGYCGHCA